MKLVIGGYSQGKLNYVLNKINQTECCIWDATLPTEEQLQAILAEEKTVIINHFHRWIRECILQEKNPEEKMEKLLSQTIECIIISDEIGNGIVPIEAFEREYRERTGRILVKLAGQADEVVRVVCGIGQKIK